MYDENPEHANGLAFIKFLKDIHQLVNATIIANMGWINEKIVAEAKESGVSVVLDKISMKGNLVKTLHDLGVTAGVQK